MAAQLPESDFKMDTYFLELGLWTAPAEPIDLPAGGARSAPPAGRAMRLTITCKLLELEIKDRNVKLVSI